MNSQKKNYPKKNTAPRVSLFFFFFFEEEEERENLLTTRPWLAYASSCNEFIALRHYLHLVLIAKHRPSNRRRPITDPRMINASSAFPSPLSFVGGSVEVGRGALIFHLA